VVSRLSTIVLAQAMATTSSHSAQTRRRPARAAQCAATSNTPARSAISATTVMVTRNARTGRTRAARSVSSGTVMVGPTLHREDPRPARPGRRRQLHGEGGGHDLGQLPRRARVHARDAQVARHQATGVLGQVRGPGHLDPHPPLRRGAPRRPCGGIRAAARVDDQPAPRRSLELAGQRSAPVRGQGTQRGQVDRIESRYAGMRSVSLSAPNSAEETRTQRCARRRAAVSRLDRPRAS